VETDGVAVERAEPLEGQELRVFHLVVVAVGEVNRLVAVAVQVDISWLKNFMIRGFYQ
jgi:hypothetical protein